VLGAAGVEAIVRRPLGQGMKQAPPEAAPKKKVAPPPQVRLRQRPPQETPALLQPTHKSHPLSRSYRAILPTSLIYIFSKTRDLISLKPAADYCTTLLEYYSFQMIFMESGKGRENFLKDEDVLQGHGVCQSVTLIRHSVGFKSWTGRAGSRVAPTTSPSRPCFLFPFKQRRKLCSRFPPLSHLSVASPPKITQNESVATPSQSNGILTIFPFDSMRN